ncbi:hypothetical protein P170DRAFT_248571 [Aspergillus steynii IBT 23096]|uniref:Uncharacterized protein n=1 Tax=Aspergillus steynii IBT 23096 TaxID=1392250 RepID=A0A2I2FYD7_9EURO|nr:uncharacterized protein P170DRAFT_248571 [Aspergillus steynii IBT 23096]PLB45655.1 hypothetical protein P170DRAFT_248571 [Aspergillus steynii IBT 23096]
MPLGLSPKGRDRVSVSALSKQERPLAPGTVPLEKFHRIPRGLSYPPPLRPLAWLPKWSCCDDKVPLTGDSVSLLCLSLVLSLSIPVGTENGLLRIGSFFWLCFSADGRTD